MKDAYKIKGEKITYQEKNWEIGNVFFVPGNSELYVELVGYGVFYNVRLNDVIKLITNIKK
jgi:hypothetical protein